MSLLAKCELRIAKAKTTMIIRHPFFAVIACSAIYRNARECGLGGEVDTMATDGKYIYWDEDYVDSVSDAELLGTIVHECFHIIYLHMFRRGNRDLKIWNYACDYVINQLIFAMGLKLPAFVLNNPKYAQWLAEKVYDDLMKRKDEVEKEINDILKKLGKKMMPGSFIPPRNGDGKPMSDAEKSTLKHEIKMRVTKAAASAKAIGKLPAGIEALVQAVGKTAVDWQSYIHSWVSVRRPDDYSWRTPNRKWMTNHDIYMPRMEGRGAGTGLLSIDNSGSVSMPELTSYVTNIAAMIEACNPEKLIIVQHDSKIQRIDEWEQGMEFKDLLIKGRGGTMIKPVFKYAEELEEPIDWMICFTDMGIRDWPKPEEAPAYPVLWAATGEDKAPFGTYLDLRNPEHV